MEFKYTTPCAVQDIAPISPEDMGRLLCDRVQQGWRLLTLCGVPQSAFDPAKGGVGLLCVLANNSTGRYQAARTPALLVYDAFTPLCPQAHWFEREIYEQWGILPQGHPWLKPVRFVVPADGGSRPLPGNTNYFRVNGNEVHEVAVGPIHAGVIEPGHFRFQCYGETVMYLEISLGFQHRGLELLLHDSPHPRSLRLVECAAGDASIAHATAYAALLEKLAGRPATPRGQALRSVALELERLACHTGDLGAMGGDVGFLPTSAWCGRIRGDFLNMTGMLCGNRFGRGMICPGGTVHDLDEELCTELLRRLDAAHRDTRGAVDIMLDAASVLDRFEDTGIVGTAAASDMGLVGVAARASGLEMDARYHFPLGEIPAQPARLRSYRSGDVLARALVRSEEVDDAVTIIHQTLKNLSPRSSGPCRDMHPRTPAPGLLAVSCVEGWRGEVCHVGISDARGKLALYKIIDPSFHNWMGLSLALRNQEISDFPLCNKSFNLSYCGHDL